MGPKRFFGISAITAELLLCFVSTSAFSTATAAQTASPAAVNAPVAGPSSWPAGQVATKVSAPFTLTMVGDLQGPRAPITRLDQPGLQSMIKLLRDADVAFANQEGALKMGVNAKATVAEIKAMGIKMMSQANNHAMDSGAVDMLGTGSLLDDAGIAHSGSGKDLLDARAPAYLFTPKGVVALISIFAIDPNQVPLPSQLSGATYPHGDRPGHPGVNSLYLTAYYNVTEQQLKELQHIHDSIYLPPSPSLPLPDHWVPGTSGYGNLGPNRVELFGTFYQTGPKPGTISYSMHPDDLREILTSIRTAKEYADFVVVSIHAHQYSVPWQSKVADPRIREAGVDDGVPDYLIDLAHQAIDNGADAFTAAGVHTMRGIEVYQGKPVFYGMSNFLQMGMLSPAVSNVKATDQRSEGLTGEVSLATDRILSRPPDGGWGVQAWGSFPNALQAQLAACHYDHGHLVEIRIYPVDLGLEASRPVSLLGLPMTPSSAVARQILEKIQELSKPFGTTISIEDSIGVIRVESRPPPITP
jgi:poly-gamma-glutamate synthesis protein (capsule biosynthesis protein)